MDGPESWPAFHLLVLKGRFGTILLLQLACHFCAPSVRRWSKSRGILVDTVKCRYIICSLLKSNKIGRHRANAQISVMLLSTATDLYLESYMAMTVK